MEAKIQIEEARNNVANDVKEVKSPGKNIVTICKSSSEENEDLNNVENGSKKTISMNNNIDDLPKAKTSVLINDDAKVTLNNSNVSVNDSDNSRYNSHINESLRKYRRLSLDGSKIKTPNIFSSDIRKPNLINNGIIET